jgi:hypothetical protein
MVANMALGLFNEAKSLNRQSDDWERNITHFERDLARHDRQQAIKAAFSSIVQFFRRPTTPALRVTHA